jgi:hypothetical protein
MGLDPKIRFSHVHIPDSLESNKLYSLVSERPYIFIQQASSGPRMELITWDKNKILTLDPNENVYNKDESFYSLAENFVNKPFFHYVKVIQNASELHLINSSFACLSLYIKPLKASIKKCYDRETQKEDNGFFDKMP